MTVDIANIKASAAQYKAALGVEPWQTALARRDVLDNIVRAQLDELLRLAELGQLYEAMTGQPATARIEREYQAAAWNRSLAESVSDHHTPKPVERVPAWESEEGA